MTGGAFDSLRRMGISQRKPGFIMVEPTRCCLPVALRMAFCAFLTQGIFVFVIFLVASDAFLGCLFEHGAFVTLFALDFGVLAQQWKAAFVVVELGRLFPTTFSMATCAVFTQ